MWVPLKIAKRYLFSKKSINVINIIAIISTVGISIATAALIIILSVFNGLEKIIVSQFNSFSPELKVSLNQGKFFDIDSVLTHKLESIDNIKDYAFVLEDYAAIKYNDITHPFSIMGVDDHYVNVSGIDSMLFEGDFTLKNDKEYFAVVGYDVAQKLSIGLSFINPMLIYAPKRTQNIVHNPLKAFNKKYLFPSAIFGIDESVDSKILVDIKMMQDLFELDHKATDIALSLKNPKEILNTQLHLESLLGEQFTVKTRVEQNSFYKILNSERFMIYLVLGFVLLIAAFNIVATLTMLMVDKKKEFVTFKSIGLNNTQIKMIFLLNGWMTSVFGAVIGLILGGFIAWLQIKFGIVSFGDGYDITAYPVDIKTLDFIKVFLLVLVIGFFTSLIPLRNFNKQYLT